MTLLAVLLSAAALAALWLGLSFNRLVRLRNLLDEAFSGVDVQLKRRHDLVPKLLDVAKGASKFEKETQVALAEARESRALPEREAAEKKLGAAITRILARAEAYPELKSVAAWTRLQKEIAQVEDELQYARRYFNACVRDHNVLGQSFPFLLVAAKLGFAARPYFLLEGAERESPSLS